MGVKNLSFLCIVFVRQRTGQGSDSPRADGEKVQGEVQVVGGGQSRGRELEEVDRGQGEAAEGGQRPAVAEQRNAADVDNQVSCDALVSSALRDNLMC